MRLFKPNVQRSLEKKDQQALIKALNDPDADIRSRAADALDRLEWQPGSDELSAIYWIAKKQWQKCIELGPFATVPLIAALKDKDENVRNAAVRALGEIRDKQAVGPLMAMLKDKVWIVQYAAADALAKLGQPAVVPLIAALEDKDKYVRNAAVRALGEIRDKQAVPYGPLMAMLKDKVGIVQNAAEDALAKLGQPAVVPLIDALEDKDKYVRIAAVRVLGEIRDEQAVGPLMVMLKDKDRHICYAAADALVKIGQPAVVPLIAALEDNDKYVRIAAVRALGEIRDEQAVGPLMAMLKVEVWDTFDALVKIGQPAVVPLIAALEDNDKYVRIAAVRALKRIGGDEQAIGPLIAALNDYSNSLEMRLECYTVLKQIPGSNIPESDVQKLVESAAMQIRSLYSRKSTRTVTDHEFVTNPEGGFWTPGYDYVGKPTGSDEWYEPIVHVNRVDKIEKVSDPAYSSIFVIINKIPTTLRGRVRALSGKASTDRRISWGRLK